jgi:hypothetical protein
MTSNKHPAPTASKRWTRIVTLVLVALSVSFSGCRAKQTEVPVAPEVSDPTPAVVEPAPIAYGRVTENRVRVRRAPGLDAEPVGHLYQRDLVAIYSRSDESEEIDGVTAPWIEVETPLGLSGWSFGRFVEEIPVDEYGRLLRQLTVATANLPWEPGAVTEEVLPGSMWESLSGVPQDAATARVDFAPESVSTVGGSPFALDLGADRRIGVFRVRNGYLVTWVELPESAGAAQVASTAPFGLIAWNLIEDDGSLVPLYRSDVSPLVPAPPAAEQ